MILLSSAYEMFLGIHNVLRWVLLLSGFMALLLAVKGMSTKSLYGKTENRWRLVFTIMNHSQLLIGLLLYFVFSPITKSALSNMGAAMKDASLRFWAVEHFTTMLIAVILVTIGGSKVKKAASDASKHKLTLIFFGIAMLLILSMIPWPFGANPRPWFRI